MDLSNIVDEIVRVKLYDLLQQEMVQVLNIQSNVGLIWKMRIPHVIYNDYYVNSSALSGTTCL